MAHRREPITSRTARPPRCRPQPRGPAVKRVADGHDGGSEAAGIARSERGAAELRARPQRISEHRQRVPSEGRKERSDPVPRRFGGASDGPAPIRSRHGTHMARTLHPFASMPAASASTSTRSSREPQVPGERTDARTRRHRRDHARPRRPRRHAVELAKKHGATVIAPVELGDWLRSQGVETVKDPNKGGTVEIDGIRFTMTHAQHSSRTTTAIHGEPCGHRRARRGRARLLRGRHERLRRHAEP